MIMGRVKDGLVVRVMCMDVESYCASGFLLAGVYYLLAFRFVSSHILRTRVEYMHM